MNLSCKIIFFICFCKNVAAQNIPIATIDFENVKYRNLQLLNDKDSITTFCIYPLNDLVKTNYLNPKKTAATKTVDTKILPITITNQFNTFSPVIRNDGALIPAKGFQMLATAGFYFKYKSLRVQLKPEIVYAANPAFENFPIDETSSTRIDKIYYLNYSDIPEIFGNTSYNKMFWGQSNVTLTIKNIDIGISSENLWWGPGQYNSLIMSNNAPGFLHSSIKTRKPIKTYVGFFEAQLISGILQNSMFEAPEQAYIVDGINYKLPKSSESRYLSGLTINYQPKWIPGFVVGLNRAFQIYPSDLRSSFFDYFPVVTPFLKNNLTDEDEKRRDQLASLFFKFRLKKSKFEFYFESGWNDHSASIRDLFQSPEHSQAILFGCSKVWNFPIIKDSYLKLNYERTQLQQTADRIVRPSGAWYLHGIVRHGYTNMGQVLGAGIGPGGDLQTIDCSLWSPSQIIGVQFERFAHNIDFFYDTYEDYNRKWIDLSINTYAFKQFGKIGVQAKLNTVWMNNYQWQLNSNKFNMHFQVSTQYNF